MINIKDIKDLINILFLEGGIFYNAISQEALLSNSGRQEDIVMFPTCSNTKNKIQIYALQDIIKLNQELVPTHPARIIEIQNRLEDLLNKRLLEIKRFIQNNPNSILARAGNTELELRQMVFDEDLIEINMPIDINQEAYNDINTEITTQENLVRGLGEHDLLLPTTREKVSILDRVNANLFRTTLCLLTYNILKGILPDGIEIEPGNISKDLIARLGQRDMIQLKDTEINIIQETIINISKLIENLTAEELAEAQSHIKYLLEIIYTAADIGRLENILLGSQEYEITEHQLNSILNLISNNETIKLDRTLQATFLILAAPVVFKNNYIDLVTGEKFLPFNEQDLPELEIKEININFNINRENLKEFLNNLVVNETHISAVAALEKYLNSNLELTIEHLSNIYKIVLLIKLEKFPNFRMIPMRLRPNADGKLDIDKLNRYLSENSYTIKTLITDCIIDITAYINQKNDIKAGPEENLGLDLEKSAEVVSGVEAELLEESLEVAIALSLELTADPVEVPAEPELEFIQCGVMDISMRLCSKNINIVGPCEDFLALPNVPVILPEEFNNSEIFINELEGNKITKFSFVSNIDTLGSQSFIAELKTKLYTLHPNLNLENIDCFICFQDKPFGQQALFFSPQLWLHGDEEGESNILYGIVDLDNPNENNLNLLPSVINTNKICENGISSYNYSSDNKMELVNLKNDYLKTSNIISICIDTNNNKAALTYHCLLNSLAQEHMEQILCTLQYEDSSITLNKLLQILKNDSMQEVYGMKLDVIESLFRNTTNNITSKNKQNNKPSAKQVHVPNTKEKIATIIRERSTISEEIKQVLAQLPNPEGFFDFQRRVKVSGWHNSCGYNVLADHIVNCLINHPDKFARFSESTVSQRLLTEIQAYYSTDDKNLQKLTWQHIKELFQQENFNNQHAVTMILSPIIRRLYASKRLEDYQCLSKEQQEELLDNTFVAQILLICRNSLARVSNADMDPNYVIISSNYIKDELLPRFDNLAGNFLETDKETLIDVFMTQQDLNIKKWCAQEAYPNYLTLCGDIKYNADLGAEELNVLAEWFGIKLTTFSNEPITRRDFLNIRPENIANYDLYKLLFTCSYKVSIKVLRKTGVRTDAVYQNILGELRVISSGVHWEYQAETIAIAEAHNVAFDNIQEKALNASNKDLLQQVLYDYHCSGSDIYAYSRFIADISTSLYALAYGADKEPDQSNIVIDFKQEIDLQSLNKNDNRQIVMESRPFLNIITISIANQLLYNHDTFLIEAANNNYYKAVLQGLKFLFNNNDLSWSIVAELFKKELINPKLQQLVLGIIVQPQVLSKIIEYLVCKDQTLRSDFSLSELVNIQQSFNIIYNNIISEKKAWAGGDKFCKIFYTANTDKIKEIIAEYKEQCRRVGDLPISNSQLGDTNVILNLSDFYTYYKQTGRLNTLQVGCLDYITTAMQANNADLDIKTFYTLANNFSFALQQYSDAAVDAAQIDKINESNIIGTKPTKSEIRQRVANARLNALNGNNDLATDPFLIIRLVSTPEEVEVLAENQSLAKLQFNYPEVHLIFDNIIPQISMLMPDVVAENYLKNMLDINTDNIKELICNVYIKIKKILETSVKPFVAKYTVAKDSHINKDSTNKAIPSTIESLQDFIKKSLCIAEEETIFYYSAVAMFYVNKLITSGNNIFNQHDEPDEHCILEGIDKDRFICLVKLLWLINNDNMKESDLQNIIDLIKDCKIESLSACEEILNFYPNNETLYFERDEQLIAVDNYCKLKEYSDEHIKIDATAKRGQNKYIAINLLRQIQLDKFLTKEVLEKIFKLTLLVKENPNGLSLLHIIKIFESGKVSQNLLTGLFPTITRAFSDLLARELTAFEKLAIKLEANKTNLQMHKDNLMHPNVLITPDTVLFIRQPNRPSLPNVPFILTCNNLLSVNRSIAGAMRFSFTDTQNNIPHCFKAILSQLRISTHNTKFCILLQALLTHEDKLSLSAQHLFNSNTYLIAAVSEINNKSMPPALYNKTEIHTMRIVNFDSNQTKAFYSLVIPFDHETRSFNQPIITLHCLLSSADLRSVSEAIELAQLYTISLDKTKNKNSTFEISNFYQALEKTKFSTYFPKQELCAFMQNKLYTLNKKFGLENISNLFLEKQKPRKNTTDDELRIESEWQHLKNESNKDESSMNFVSDRGSDLIKKLIEKYGNKLNGQVQSILVEMATYCKNKFKQETGLDPNPSDAEIQRMFSQAKRMTDEARGVNISVHPEPAKCNFDKYRNSIYHAAYRYLATENYFIHPNADHCRFASRRDGKWGAKAAPVDSFYGHFALFWLAITDPAHSEELKQSLIETYCTGLREMLRAHNQDRGILRFCLDNSALGISNNYYLCNFSSANNNFVSTIPPDPELLRAINSFFVRDVRDSSVIGLVPDFSRKKVVIAKNGKQQFLTVMQWDDCGLDRPTCGQGTFSRLLDCMHAHPIQQVPKTLDILRQFNLLADDCLLEVIQECFGKYCVDAPTGDLVHDMALCMTNIMSTVKGDVNFDLKTATWASLLNYVALNKSNPDKVNQNRLYGFLGNGRNITEIQRENREAIICLMRDLQNKMYYKLLATLTSIAAQSEGRMDDDSPDIRELTAIGFNINIDPSGVGKAAIQYSSYREYLTFLIDVAFGSIPNTQVIDIKTVFLAIHGKYTAIIDGMVRDKGGITEQKQHDICENMSWVEMQQSEIKKSKLAFDKISKIDSLLRKERQAKVVSGKSRSSILSFFSKDAATASINRDNPATNASHTTDSGVGVPKNISFTTSSPIANMGQEVSNSEERRVSPTTPTKANKRGNKFKH